MLTKSDVFSKYRVLSHDALLESVGPKGLNWLVEGFMPADAYCVLSGDSKCGKSALATHLAYRIAQGEPFLGLPTVRSAVLWLNFEESESERATPARPYPSGPVYAAFQPDKVDTPEGVQAIREIVGAIEEECGLRVGLIVVDPLVEAVSRDSMSETVNARRGMAPLNDLRRELGVAVLVIHHHRKGHSRKGDPSKIADSHQIMAAASQGWVMEVDGRNGRNGRTITLHGYGRGAHANKPWRIESSDEWTFRLVGEPAQERSEGSGEEDANADERFLAALQGEPGGLTSRQVAERTGLHHPTAKNSATRLLKSKRIVEFGKKGNAIWWALSDQTGR